VDTLVHAFAKVRQAVPDSLLVLVGCPPPDETAYETQCRALIRDLGLGAAVRFVGYRLDVPAWMRTFDVFALPTRSEPFGKVVIEAMAAGRPVVASAVGGIPEIVTSPELGTLIRPDDSTQLAVAVIDYLRQREKARRTGARAAASVRERFGLTSMISALEGLYREVLAGSRAGGGAASRAPAVRVPKTASNSDGSADRRA
jgi:glycosyltransferase involved in cell wall biosynthesis